MSDTTVGGLTLCHNEQYQLKWVRLGSNTPPIGWEPVPMGTLNNDINPLARVTHSYEIEVDFE